MKLKMTAFLAAVCTMLGCGMSEETRQVKLYQDQLGPMLGREKGDVKKLITEKSQFLLLDRWKAENPGVETVLKNNYRIHGFSREEARKEFAIPGVYEVEIYLKKQTAETARVATTISSTVTGRESGARRARSMASIDRAEVSGSQWACRSMTPDKSCATAAAATSCASSPFTTSASAGTASRSRRAPPN